MLVYSKVNAIIPSKDGREKVRVNRGEVADVPKWCAATNYFKLLVADGSLVTTSKATADKDVRRAENKKPAAAGDGEKDNYGQSEEIGKPTEGNEQ